MEDKKLEILKTIDSLDKTNDVEFIDEILKRITPKARIWQVYDNYTRNTMRVHYEDELTLGELLEYGYNSIRLFDKSNKCSMPAFNNTYMGCDKEELHENGYNLDTLVIVEDFIDDSDGYPCVVVSIVDNNDDESEKLVNKTLSLNMSIGPNAAFQDGNDTYETCRILRSIADSIEAGRTHGICIDINGNGVGDWSIEDN